MEYIKSFNNFNKVNEEIFGLNKIIKRAVGTYREPVYVYIIKGSTQSYVQNDWTVASSVNRRLMEMMDDRFNIEVESEGNWSNWKIKNSDIDEIESFLSSIGLSKREFKEGEDVRIIYRGKLSIADIKDYDLSSSEDNPHVLSKDSSDLIPSAESKLHENR